MVGIGPVVHFDSLQLLPLLLALALALVLAPINATN